MVPVQIDYTTIFSVPYLIMEKYTSMATMILKKKYYDV